VKTYKALARLIGAKQNCITNKNEVWLERHQARIDEIMKTAPSGSGIDCGTKLLDDSTDELLLFSFSYHHMNEDGFYTHWTNHLAIVQGSLWDEFRVFISGDEDEDCDDECHLPEFSKWYCSKDGPDTDQEPVDQSFLDYTYDVFSAWLSEEIKETE